MSPWSSLRSQRPMEFTCSIDGLAAHFTLEPPRCLTFVAAENGARACVRIHNHSSAVGLVWKIMSTNCQHKLRRSRGYVAPSACSTQIIDQPRASTAPTSRDACQILVLPVSLAEMQRLEQTSENVLRDALAELWAQRGDRAHKHKIR